MHHTQEQHAEEDQQQEGEEGQEATQDALHVPDGEANPGPNRQETGGLAQTPTMPPGHIPQEKTARSTYDSKPKARPERPGLPRPQFTVEEHAQRRPR